MRILHSRRDFLRDSAALVAAGSTIPNFLARTALAMGPHAADDERILVVVQLTGGNDGLNTVVPFADDAYYRARPTLAVPRGTALRLDDHVALHPQARGLKALFDDGWLSVIQNVGYPNPDRSHFSSMDIWHCADPGLKDTQTGWLGRVADLRTSGGGAAYAIHLDHEAMPLALRTQQVAVPSVADISSLKLDPGPGGPRMAKTIERAVRAPRENASDAVLYVQRAAVAACAQARRLEKLRSDAPTAAAYPDYGLARRLREIALLINAEFGARVYYTSLGGFDTHAKQAETHAALLSELGGSIQAFFKDLKSRGLADRVLLMTFSEFGRRVKENGSQGTDHGAAAPIFLAGPACKAGIVGEKPDLTNLVEGDVGYEIDFRRVYATLLERHLGVDAAAVLRKSFSILPIVNGA